MIQLAEGIMLDERGIDERFVRASGTGGQNPNREAIAVELRLDIGAASLPPDVKDRLVVLAGRAVTKGGVLVVVSRVHRSQAKNRDAARARLMTLLQRAAKRPRVRRPTKPGVTVREKRLSSKQLLSETKKSRQRVRPAAE
jgi:ribosome-associated protein